MASSSSSSSAIDWKYDVFLNFRGEDSRKTFVGHLYEALVHNSINTSIDAEELRKGNDLSQLLKAISGSRLSIVVFSQNYASSRRCFKELVHILHCIDTHEQMVVPIFYGVDPSHVCKLEGSFAEAFSKHEHDSNADMEEVQGWSSALRRVPKLSGWDSRNYERKIGYLHGSIKAPNEDDPKYDDWFTEDQKIKSWLLSSMKSEIMKRYIRLSTSKEIWDSIKVAYFDENDEARIYSLNQKASRLRQNGRPLATYFGELTEIFQELDHFNKVSMECENDVKVFQKSTERQRVYVFLGGLDDEFDQVRGEVLQKDPPLSLQASYAYVRREADRKEAIKTEVDKSEPAVIAAKASGSSSWYNRDGSQHNSGQTRPSQTNWDRPQGKCPHCGMTGQSKSSCFELIRYPENWDKTCDPRCNKSRASIAETKNDSDSIADKASAMIAAEGSDGHPDAEDDWLWY